MDNQFIPEWAINLPRAAQLELAKEEKHKQELSAFNRLSPKQKDAQLKALEEKISIEGRRNSDPKQSILVSKSTATSAPGALDI